ncbi:MAG: RNA-binding protein [Candidatus Methanoplasma sp.]|jgi:translin|nr:RNA-binding protein [Candidatus Methanoplasma sp.]
MDSIAATAERASKRMAEIELARNAVVAESRAAIRETKRVIHAVHVGEDRDLRAIREGAERLVSLTESEPSVSYSAVDALAECAEALILCSITDEGSVPSFESLRMPAGAWILGFADCIGELRRMLLNDLATGNTSHAEALFKTMEEMFHALMMLDVPDSVLPIRRKQDIARGIMERTHSDLTSALVLRKSRT